MGPRKRPKRLRTIDSLAAAIGVSVWTVRQWEKAGLPTAKGGGWILEEVRTWRTAKHAAAVAARAAGRRRRPADETALRRLTRVDRVPAGEQPEPSPSRPLISFDTDVDEQLKAGIRPRIIVAEQEARRRYWLAERERIAARQAAGELVEADRVLDEKVKLCAGFRRLIFDLCRRAAPSLLGLDDTLAAQRVLEAEAELALSRVQQIGGLPA